MKKLLFTILLCLLFVSCMTPARVLTEVKIGSTQQLCIKKLGNPESISLSFISPDNKYIEVWDYRLYQYEMATSLSPYYDIYSLLFVDGVLKRYEKTYKGERISEKAALKLLGYSDITVSVTD